MDVFASVYDNRYSYAPPTHIHMYSCMCMCLVIAGHDGPLKVGIIQTRMKEKCERETGGPQYKERENDKRIKETGNNRIKDIETERVSN